MKTRKIMGDWRLWFWLFTALTLVIGYLSLVRAPTVRIGFDVRNRTVHFLAYFFYSAVVGMWRIIVSGNKEVRSFGQAGFISVVYGTLLEWLQMYLPGRDSDPLDAIFNALGGITGAALACFYFSKRYLSGSS